MPSILVRGSRLSWALCLALGLVNCAHSKAPVRRPALEQLQKPKSIRLGATVILKSVDPLTGRDIYDAPYLFHLAGEAERNEDSSRAAHLYERLMTEFSEGIYYVPAVFNLGLLHEEEEDYGDAVDVYSILVKMPQPSSLKTERIWLLAHFRLAVCFGKLKRWWDSTGIFDYLLELEELSQWNRFEALTGRGISIHEADDPEGAEIALSTALRFFRKLSRNRQIAGMELVSEAAFRMGEIARARFDKIVLSYPIEVMRERLEAKCGELLSAQGRYLRAMRYGEPRTVAAAGYQMGSLYELLYDEIMELETPEDLTEDQAEVYWEEVRNKLGVLVRKAIRIYEKALLVGKKGEPGEWTSRLERSLERLKTIYLQGNEG